MSHRNNDAFVAVTRHEEFYINGGDLFFLIDNVQFRVHRYFFERESSYFRGKLTTPASPGASRLGVNESSAIILEGVRPAEFAKFLWVFYNPKYSLYKAPIEDWMTILSLSHRWTFPEVKSLAVREMEKLPCPDIDRIVAYHDSDVDRNLLIPRYAALCEREEPLTLPEGLRLGMETTLMIARAREYARAQVAANGLRSPTVSNVRGNELHKIVRELFGIPVPVIASPDDDPISPGGLSLPPSILSSHPPNPPISMGPVPPRPPRQNPASTVPSTPPNPPSQPLTPPAPPVQQMSTEKQGKKGKNQQLQTQQQQQQPPAQQQQQRQKQAPPVPSPLKKELVQPPLPKTKTPSVPPVKTTPPAPEPPLEPPVKEGKITTTTTTKGKTTTGEGEGSATTKADVQAEEVKKEVKVDTKVEVVKTDEVKEDMKANGVKAGVKTEGEKAAEEKVEEAKANADPVAVVAGDNTTDKAKDTPDIPPSLPPKDISDTTSSTSTTIIPIPTTTTTTDTIPTPTPIATTSPTTTATDPIPIPDPIPLSAPVSVPLTPLSETAVSVTAPEPVELVTPKPLLDINFDKPFSGDGSGDLAAFNSQNLWSPIPGGETPLL